MNHNEETLELEIIPIRELYYSEKSNWGSYAVNVENIDDRDKVRFNRYGNISIVGVMPRLEINVTYNAVLEYKGEHEKYGPQYELKRVHTDFSSQADQHKFLYAILPPTLATSLIESYKDENIIELIQQDKIDINKVHGLGEVTYKRVREKVLENLELHEALVELSDYGVTYNTIKKLVDEYGSAQLAVQVIKKNPYELTKLHGFGFKKVDPIALKMGVKKESQFRIHAGVRHVLQEEASNGHCWIKGGSLLNKASELLGLSTNLIKKYLKSDKSGEFYLKNGRIGLYKYYYYELTIFNKINELLASEARAKVENIEEKIKQAEEEQGFPYTDEQKEAIKTFAKENVMILDGRAGSGKSTTLRGIIKVFMGKEAKYRIHPCALAGKAARRIEETTGVHSQTIHKLLGYSREGFKHNAQNPLFTDIVIVDEMSMVDTSLFYALITALTKGTKILLVGDTEQLPSIGAGSVFLDLINSKRLPHCSLTKVQRQAADSGILSVANAIRDGKKVISRETNEITKFGKEDDFIFFPKEEDTDILKHVIKICKSYKKRGLDVDGIQVISPMRKRGKLSTNTLNKYLQEIFNPKQSEDDIVYEYGQREYRIGDRVMQMVNNYDKDDQPIMNGNIGKITDIIVDEKGKKHLVINFPDAGAVVTYTGDQLKDIDLCYCSSVHKLQGSEAPFVIIALSYSHYVLLSKQLLYTAITRAKSKCVLIGEPKAIAHSIKTVSTKRNTWLRELFEEKQEEENAERR